MNLPDSASAFPLAPPFSWDAEFPELRPQIDRLLAQNLWSEYEGQVIEELAGQLKHHAGTAHVQLCCSGSVALELALKAAGIGAGDEVLLASYDYPGNFRILEELRCNIRLVDLHEHRWTLDLEQLEQARTERTRGLVAAHLHGTLCDAPAIRQWCDRHGIFFLEDAAQATGAKISGKTAGSFGHAGVWSFGGSKLITAGRGGALFTEDPSLAQRIKLAAQRGSDAFAMSQLQAASLRPQLAKLEEHHRRRQLGVAFLRQELSKVSQFLSPAAAPWEEDLAYYKLGWIWNSDSPDALAQLNQFLFGLREKGMAIGGGFSGFHRRVGKRCQGVGSLEHGIRAAQWSILLHHRHLLGGEQHLKRIAIELCQGATRPGS